MFTSDRLRELTERECRALLAAHQHGVGRLAFVPPAVIDIEADGDAPSIPLLGAPEVLPVNYVVDVDRIIIRSAEGAKLRAASAGVPMSFQLDSAGVGGPPADHRWTVLVRGRSRVVTDADDLRYLSLSQLQPDAGGFRPWYLSVAIEQVTGRRL